MVWGYHYEDPDEVLQSDKPKQKDKGSADYLKEDWDIQRIQLSVQPIGLRHQASCQVVHDAL